ncbi:hypothetical protein CEP54_013868 [Fusarium duplospermum]|uniref:Uncharacterized protein n=1 Tax=Fusarium duplospermum TaxID=1325734 RepID=A0A428NZU9_9HYPO|nr:hypothetical protein CEP54_013868 [Fusarium duplospermum]
MASNQNGVSSRDESPEFTIDYNESRPYVQEYQKPPKFNAGDTVMFQQDKNLRPEGPFIVASVSPEGKYLLCLVEDGSNELKPVKDGMEINEEHLKSA